MFRRAGIAGFTGVHSAGGGEQTGRAAIVAVGERDGNLDTAVADGTADDAALEVTGNPVGRQPRICSSWCGKIAVTPRLVRLGRGTRVSP